MPSFTPEQLADVYVSRWQIRDMTNWFIRELKPVRMSYSEPPKLIRTVGFQVKIRRHEIASDWPKENPHA